MLRTIAPDSPRSDDVRELLDAHLDLMKETSPPEDVHALDIDGLCVPEISFFSCRVDGHPLGVGALKHLTASHAELKSMHTAAGARGQGIGRAMLEFLVDLARTRGYERLSLETGTMAAFEPARTLYASIGFAPCPPFGEYPDSPNSVCMTMALAHGT